MTDRLLCGYSIACTPTSLMTFAQNGASDLIRALNSFGVLDRGTTPELSMAVRISGSAMMRTISVFNLSTIADGVPAGTNTPNQGVISKSAKPSSIMVGSSGAKAARERDVAARGRTFPELIRGKAAWGL